MPTLRIVSDQAVQVTARFYKAMATRIIEDVVARWGAEHASRLGICLHAVGLGDLENHPDKVAQKVAALVEPGDLVLLVRDTEGRDAASVLEHERVVKAVAALVAGEDLVLGLLIRPITEAAYLVDRRLEVGVAKVVEMWNRKHRHRRPISLDDLRALARDRRARARSNKAPDVAKDRVYRVLGVQDRDKAELSAFMSQWVGHTTYTLPPDGEVPDLDRVRDWIERHMTAVELSPQDQGVLSCFADAAGRDEAWIAKQEHEVGAARGMFARNGHGEVIAACWWDHGEVIPVIRDVWLADGAPGAAADVVLRRARRRLLRERREVRLRRDGAHEGCELGAWMDGSEQYYRSQWPDFEA